jgi:uncharacterized protein YqeY
MKKLVMPGLASISCPTGKLALTVSETAGPMTGEVFKWNGGRCGPAEECTLMAPTEFETGFSASVEATGKGNGVLTIGLNPTLIAKCTTFTCTYTVTAIDPGRGPGHGELLQLRSRDEGRGEKQPDLPVHRLVHQPLHNRRTRLAPLRDALRAWPRHRSWIARLPLPVRETGWATATLCRVSVLEQVQADVRTAMKAGERERAGALRLIVDSLQKDAKLGDGDEVAVLQRERKKRVEAADAYAEAGREEQAGAERFEAELIEGYLPQQLSDAELAELVDAAVSETGASEQKQMGQVMSALMPKLAGRADGKRVSAAVRERLGA